MKIKVDHEYLPTLGFPHELGATLAANLMIKQPDWNDLELDVSWLPAKDLISAFFISFMQAIYEAYPNNTLKLDQARKIRWNTRFEFQQTNIERWTVYFKPFVSTAPISTFIKG